MFVWCWLPAGQAVETEGKARDELVYRDGDRVQGRWIGQKGGLIVFQSDRFGELRVPAKEAVVIKAEKTSRPASPAVAAAPVSPPANPETLPAKPAAKAAGLAEEEQISGWEYFSPARLNAGLRDFFGNWHGRFAFSTEAVSDTADRNSLSLETQLKRKWQADQVQLNARYDFNKTNNLATTDLVKGDGLWRHDFSKWSFAQYRPSLEWNRASFTNKVPSDYVLGQQEIGAGVNLLTTPARKLRLGVSENLFDIWNTAPVDTHSSHSVESAFVETESKLPWGMLLTDRGVYYYSIRSQSEGWENRVELTKKFTETLSTAIRHETRQGNPDGKAQDYTRLKLLFGLEF